MASLLKFLKTTGEGVREGAKEKERKNGQEGENLLG